MVIGFKVVFLLHFLLSAPMDKTEQTENVLLRSDSGFLQPLLKFLLLVALVQRCQSQ